MLSARAGTYPRFSPCSSTTSRRIAASTCAGVVFRPVQTRPDRSPLIVALEGPARLLGPLAAGVVGGQWGPAEPVPALEDRVDGPPLRLDLVVAGEQRRVAAHRIGDQPLVGLRRLGQERRSVL